MADCSGARPLEVTEEERGSHLLVEVHTDEGLQAKGGASIASLWQVRRRLPLPSYPSSRDLQTATMQSYLSLQ